MTPEQFKQIWQSKLKFNIALKGHQDLNEESKKSARMVANTIEEMLTHFNQVMEEMQFKEIVNDLNKNP